MIARYIGPTDLKNRTGSSNLHLENEAESGSPRPYWSDHLSNCANRLAYVILALSFIVYRSVAHNCEILNGNRPLRGFLTLDAEGFLTHQQYARDFIDLKRCDCLASMKVQYIYLLFFSPSY